MDRATTSQGQNPAIRIGGACFPAGLRNERTLEARLRRTETLLRSVLPLVSDEQLESSLRNIPGPGTLDRSQDKENADPNVWQHYPLTNLEDVRAWQAHTATSRLSRQPRGIVLDEESPSEDGTQPCEVGDSPVKSSRAIPNSVIAAKRDASSYPAFTEDPPTNAYPDLPVVAHPLVESFTTHNPGGNNMAETEGDRQYPELVLLPLNAATKHLIGVKEIAQMKEGVVIINTARGAIIDEAALADGLESGKIADVGLDVCENEPAINEKLLKQERALMVPHIGTHTTETLVKMEK
ncbi:hypothetical protein SCUP234_04065 [Seiridium cupressi]